MRWGKTLPDLVKRAVEIAKETKQKYPGGVHMNVHLCWFGNELVGEEGIAQNPTWPFDGPNGHWPTIMKDCMRHLTWFKNQCDLLGVQSAGLTTAPSSADYAASTPSSTDFSKVSELNTQRSLSCMMVRTTPGIHGSRRRTTRSNWSSRTSGTSSTVTRTG